MENFPFPDQHCTRCGVLFCIVGQLFSSWASHKGPALLNPLWRDWEVSSLWGLGTLLEDDWRSLIATNGYRCFGDCVELTATLQRSLQVKHWDQHRNSVCLGPCLLPHCLQVCLWCLSLGGHTEHCHNCVIYLHPGPGGQPDHRGSVLGSVLGGDVCPCQAVKSELCPESPIISVLRTAQATVVWFLFIVCGSLGTECPDFLYYLLQTKVHSLSLILPCFSSPRLAYQ